MLMPQTGRGKVEVGRGGGEGWAYLGESILVYFGGNNELLITFFFNLHQGKFKKGCYIYGL